MAVKKTVTPSFFQPRYGVAKSASATAKRGSGAVLRGPIAQHFARQTATKATTQHTRTVQPQAAQWTAPERSYMQGSPEMAMEPQQAAQMATNPTAPAAQNNSPMMAGLQAAADDPGAGWSGESSSSIGHPGLGSRSIPAAARILSQLARVY